jgi:hypothetical protein
MSLKNNVYIFCFINKLSVKEKNYIINQTDLIKKFKMNDFFSLIKTFFILSKKNFSQKNLIIEQNLKELLFIFFNKNNYINTF